MDGSRCSFSLLFILPGIPLGTAQILQVLKQCPFRHGKISGGFFGSALGLSYSSVKAKYSNIFKDLVHGILKISLP